MGDSAARFDRFVVHPGGDPLDRTIVRAIVELARALGAETIAEWVEREHLLEELRMLGVDCAQGHALARPRPIEQL